MSDEGSVYLSLLAEDKHVIAYRPKFAALTDSAMSAILLQQIIHRWKKQQGEAFYKFKQACQHERYREGDSWCEELEWNAYEFDQALKVIGTKVTKGVKKQELLDTEPPTRNEGESDEDFLKRLETAVSRIVLYWTDSNRVTWYLLNEKLLGKFVGRIYLDKFYGLRYLKKSIASVTQKNRWLKRTLSSESPSDSSKEIDTNVSIAPPPQEQKRTTSEQKKRDSAQVQSRALDEFNATLSKKNKVVGSIEPKGGKRSKKSAASRYSAREYEESAPIYSVLIEAMGLDPMMLHGKAGEQYRDGAVDLMYATVQPEEVRGLYLYVKNMAKRDNWSSWGVNALVKRAPEYLRERRKNQPKPAAPPAPSHSQPPPADPADDEPITPEMIAEMERLEAIVNEKFNANTIPGRVGRVPRQIA